MNISTNGRNFVVLNLSVGAVSDTAITFSFTNPTPQPVTAIWIQCRTAVALQLRRNSGDTNYFTIPANTQFELKIGAMQATVGYLRSASGTVTAEVIGLLES